MKEKRMIYMIACGNSGKKKPQKFAHKVFPLRTTLIPKLSTPTSPRTAHP